MIKKLMSVIMFVVLAANVSAQEKLIINTYNRATTSLNGSWKYIVDPYENGYYNYRYEPFDQQEDLNKNAFFANHKRKDGLDLIEYDFDKMDSIQVPGDWNTQKEKLFYYEGTIWYKKSFNYTLSKTSNRLFVYFEASNYKTEVYLNGHKLGTHLGGFTPFNYEVTDIIKEKDNFLIVKVDNKRVKEGVPTLNTDWWNYGGITRDVKLVETTPNFIQDYFVQLDPNDNNKIKGHVTLNGKDVKQKKLQIKIPGLKLNKKVETNDKGKATFEITSKKIQYWSVKSPKLYDVIIDSNQDQVTDQIGFRTITTKGHEILLNGKSVFLRGICIHEESPTRPGRGYSEEDARILLERAKALGANFVRLAHYPHNEHMVRLADKMGMLVWEENPVYWTIEWKNEETYENAENQLSEVINRDKNRASVIIWSMANETPTSDVRYVFLEKLTDFARAKDPTRLISAALEKNAKAGSESVMTISDEFAAKVDILSFNEYIGWYDGSIKKCSEVEWIIEQDKPVFISEFGAGAKYGLHGSKDERWTEEYQAYLYEETLKMLDKIEQFQGVSPWILMDFRSPRRVLPEVQDGWNRKGVMSEKGEKKKAYFVLQDFYKKKAAIGK